MDPKRKCSRCSKKGDINRDTFYTSQKYGSLCAECHKEHELELLFNSMDAYAEKHGEDGLTKKLGL